MSGAPLPPSHLRPYNSYVVDPQYGRYLVYAYSAGLAALALCATPTLVRRIQTQRILQGWLLCESNGTAYRSLGKEESAISASQRPALAPRRLRPLAYHQALFHTATLYTLPLPRFLHRKVQDCCRRAYFPLTVAQCAVVLVYVAALIPCLLLGGVDLSTTGNRPGFLALSQLPFVFVLSSKAPLVEVILGKSYDRLNWLHRWTGRFLFLMAVVHGSLWSHIYITGGIGDQLSKNIKARQGYTAFAFLCVIVLSSLRIVRKVAYQVFWASHILGFVGFIIAISYHTPYSRPFVYPIIAFYTLDLVFRLLRYRVRDASLIALADGVTMIHVHDIDSGWRAGQHIWVRVFSGSRFIETHPLTITNAPLTSLPALASSRPRGLTLYAHSAGDWTRALHQAVQSDSEGTEKACASRVIVDGPYGGPSIDLEEFEDVLLLSGGSGVTFILGALDDLAGRLATAGGAMRRVRVVLILRNYPALSAYAPALRRSLDLLAKCAAVHATTHIYITNPSSLPAPSHVSLPDDDGSSGPAFPLASPDRTTPPLFGLDTLSAHTSLTLYRPDIRTLVRESLADASASNAEMNKSSSHSSLEKGQERGGSPTSAPLTPMAGGGGLGIAAAGPPALVAEVRNAVAAIEPVRAARVGGVGLHTEGFAL